MAGPIPLHDLPPASRGREGVLSGALAHPETRGAGVLGPSHNGNCREQARSLVEQNRPNELVAFEHYQRLNADQYGVPYDPDEVRYWPPLEQM